MAKRFAVCTIGKALKGGCFEVLAGFAMARTTPETRVDVTAPLTIGRLMRGELEQTPSGQVVVRLRAIEPDAEDASVLDRLRQSVVRAGLADPIASESLPALLAAHKAIGRHNELLDVQRFFTEQLMASASMFPTVDWREDVKPGLEEMNELLGKLGLALPDVDALKQQGDALLDASRSEEKARLEFCRVLGAAANAVLADAGDVRRLHEFAPPSWLDGTEPFWLLVPDAVAEGLVREKVLKRRKR